MAHLLAAVENNEQGDAIKAIYEKALLANGVHYDITYTEHGILIESSNNQGHAVITRANYFNNI